MKSKKKLVINYWILFPIIAIVLVVSIYTAPIKQNIPITTYEECLAQSNSFGGIDPKNHQQTCFFEDGRKYFKTSPPVIPPREEWGYVLPRTSDNDEMFPLTYYNFKSPSIKIGSSGPDGWSNIIIYGNGYNELYYTINENKLNLSLEKFVSFFKEGSDSITIHTFESTSGKKKITINQIPGYQVNSVTDTYVFLRHPDTTQVIIYRYASDPNWYSHPDMIKIFEKIISTTVFEPKGHE